MFKNNSAYIPIRSALRHCVLNILGLWSKPAPGIHILNGHKTLGEKEPDCFRQQLKQLSRQVRFVRIEEAVNMIINHRQPQEALVAFTFDDGFMECYDYFAPVLEEFGVNALFFVNPNYVDGDKVYIDYFNQKTVFSPNKQPMRWEHLRSLAGRGHIIGAHTMDHFMINSADEEKLTYQIVDCKKIIEQHLAQPCNYFAFPYGKLSQANQRSIQIALETYPFVFSQSDYKHYFSFNGKVINRRHFEPFWPISHIRYFLSCNKTY